MFGVYVLSVCLRGEGKTCSTCMILCALSVNMYVFTYYLVFVMWKCVYIYVLFCVHVCECVYIYICITFKCVCLHLFVGQYI